MAVIDQFTLAASEPSAGGAEIGQVILATVLISGAFGALALMVLRHRSGKGTLLARAADRSEEISGLPGWTALPLGLATVSLLTALTGMFWDISIHIDEGRDAGPLANLAHYPILLGLMGIFAAGWLAIFLPRDGERPGPAPIHLGGDWYAPIGGILIFACGGFALAGFPVDDVWHRIFGQDVTLWGPTHLQLLGGAAMTLIGQAVLLSEGLWSRREAGGDAPTSSQDRVVKLRRIAVCGGLLIGVSVYQAEFDFGVPQFRMVFEPAMIALASAFALTTARIWIGRGGALAAVAFFLVVRGLVSLFVGPVMGETTPSLPLYVGEALCIEAIALVLSTRRPLAFGAACGLAAGTVGFAAEWAWSQLVMPIPWTADILPEGLLMALVAALAGGLLGGLLGSGLRGELPRPAVARTVFAGSMVAIVALIANGLADSTPKGAEATVTVAETSTTDTASGGQPEGEIAARFTPDDVAEDASWVNVTSWQGGGLVIEPLEKGDDGVWRTDGPVPLYPDWKSILRLQNGRDLAAMPVYLPADDAIPAPEVPAEGTFTRQFVADKEVLQREVKDDVPGWLWTAATGLIGFLYLGFLTTIAWGVGRVARRQSGDPADEPAPARSAAGARRGPARPRVA